MDNCDGTITDEDTDLMWEKKDSPGGGFPECTGGFTCDNPHDVDNRYAWSSTGVVPDGPAFTDFLDKLNKTCNNDQSVDCRVGSDADCMSASVVGCCGFACHRDWRLPNVGDATNGGLREFAGILGCNFGPPCIDPIFGPTATSGYWSATTRASDPNEAWRVVFNGNGGFVFPGGDKTVCHIFI